MNLRGICAFFLLVSLISTAQKKQKILFSIENQPVFTDEFLSGYKKNSNIIDDSSKNGIADYLDLYVNYKLKVKEAIELKLDTVQKFKDELAEYRTNLIAPYLKDKEVSEKLVKEAYTRITQEIDVSHILIFLKPEPSEKDTLEAYNKLIEARNLILSGEDFISVALKYSQDPTVQQNGGRIGYFTGLQMVYPFENAAFETGINEVSMPFRTKFGYHILKVHDLRNSKGEIQTAHIMLRFDNEKSNTRIDSLYTILQKDKDQFENLAKTFSEDRASAINGGVLEKFGSGKMVESFADEAFKLNEEGELSKPFKTPFGWHIVKLIKKYPIESYDLLKAKIAEQVNNDERSYLIGDSVIKRLFKDYKIIVNFDALQELEINGDWRSNESKFTNDLLFVENEKYDQSTFIHYLKEIGASDIKKSFNNFKEKKVIEFYKNNIEKLNSDFSATFNEFKEGLLLFDLLEKRIWDKSKDSIGLTNFYNSNKLELYKNKDLEEIKGVVISDFQNYLEKQWIKELHLKYNVVFNKTEKRKVLKLKN